MAASFRPKARQFIDGRKDIFTRIAIALNGDIRPRIWMHCASLGEFEQGRPIIAALRDSYPNHCFVLTFFSPSGYEVHKHYSGVDHVFYLPVDNKRHATRFIDLVQPRLALFVKYEFWFHYLSTLKDRNIPTVLFSAIFQKRQTFFKWYGGLYRQMLGMFDQLFVQDEASKNLLARIGVTNLQVAGDTRFDRVASILESQTETPQVASFKAGHTLIIAGSTWLDDDHLLRDLMQALPDTFKLLLAPHDIQPDRLSEIKTLFTGQFSFWNSDEETLREKRICILNTIGELANAYRSADIVWVGGGFTRSGIHNIVEPAVFQKPVFFGPEYSRYREAHDMIAIGAAMSCTDITTLSRLFQNEEALSLMGHNAFTYVQRQLGATQKIMHYLDAKNF